MTLTPKGIMKRTYRDGQYSVSRKSSWLLHVAIEGPLGERAGNGFLMWLSNLPSLYDETQYVLLDVTNIGPVAEGLIDQFIKTVEDNNIGAFSILGSENAKKNLTQLIEKSEKSDKIAYSTDMQAAHRFPQQIYDNAQTTLVETVSVETKTEEKTVSSESISEKQSESSPPSP